MEDIYTIKQTGRQIKMTYGLLQKLASRFNDLGQVENLSLDYNLQNDLINEVLAERDENGQREIPLKDYSLELSLDEGKALMDWISGHIIDFFISQLQAQTKAAEKLQPLVEELQKTIAEVEKANKQSKPRSDGSKA